MDRFTNENLAQLAEQSSGPLLSLYMPTERAGREVRQNRIRLKNLVNQAEAALADAKGDTASVEKQLAEISWWEDDDEWRQHQSDGLAVFLDGKEVRSWRLPEVFPTVCHCADKFYLRPLCRFQQNDGRFYLLAVSLNDVRLFLGTKTSVAEVENADLPADLRSALNIDEYVSSLQQHSTSRSSGKGGAVMFHGHGGSDPDVKKQDEIKQYFHHIDGALDRYFGPEETPLVFAGVDYLFPLFKEASDYKALVDESVKGNPDDLSGQQLHQRAWPLVEKLFDVRRSELLDHFGTAAAQDLGSNDLAIVVDAAQRGQVETLLLRDGDPGDRDFDTTEKRVNAAIVATLKNSGSAYTVDPAQLSTSAAAIFRYPLSQAAAG